MHYQIDAARCVGCLACVRICPSEAFAIGDGDVVPTVVDEACTRCGQCVPVCPHGAVTVRGRGAERLAALVAAGDATLILAPEAASHFYPATPEQVVNAAYAAGFWRVTRGVVGDELVAAEYERLWADGAWHTLIRSTDPVVVETVRARHPALLPYLAPVVTPPEAEARYLRAQGMTREGGVVYAGVALPAAGADLDITLTFAELEAFFLTRGVVVLRQAMEFSRIPEERRRHLSMAGGMPVRFFTGALERQRPFRILRGLEQLPALERAVVHDGLQLGFIDLLAYEGHLDHPLSGPRDALFWRRALVASTEAARSRTPVAAEVPGELLQAAFSARPQPAAPGEAAVERVLAQLPAGSNGRPLDCGACGYRTCRRFAAATAAGRATLRLCAPYQERRAVEAQATAAVDELTGLSTYRVLRDRLQSEMERSKRSQEGFALLFLDLDRFKQVNDRHGHEVGNLVLRAVAEEIRRVVRASDVAARYGGDEFVVILTRTDGYGARRVAEAIRAGVEQVVRRLGYLEPMVTVSIGIAEYDPHAPGEHGLLDLADRALYRAKASGRNAVV